MKNYVSDSIKNKKLIPVLDSLLEFNKIDPNTASNMLLILAKRYTSEPGIAKMLEVKSKIETIATKRVKFVDVHTDSTLKVEQPCEGCGDSVKKEPASIEEVLALGDKAKLITIANSMGKKIRPDMDVLEIAKIILNKNSEENPVENPVENPEENPIESPTKNELDLSGKSKKELLEIARSKNISVSPAHSQTAIINAIKQASA